MNKTYLLCVGTSDEHYADCAWARVTVSPQYAQSIFARRKSFIELSARDSFLEELTFKDCEVEFLDSFDIKTVLTEEQIEVGENEGWTQVLIEEQFLGVALALPEMETGIGRFHVYSNTHIYWSGYDKYSGTLLETDTLAITELEELLP